MSFAPLKNIFTEGKEEFYSSKKSGSDMTKPMSYLTSLDLVETPSEYQIISDIPGLDPNNLNVWLEDYALCFKANRSNPYEGPGEVNKPKLHLQNRAFGEIERRVQLPKNAGLAEGTTEYKQGVLMVRFPKLPNKAEPEHKTLSINVA
jgi:HSP20 family protein